MNKNVYKLITSLVDSLNVNSGNAIFIKHYNNLNIEEKDVVNKINNRDFRVLYYEFMPNGMQEAYNPFLKWIKSEYIEHFSKTLTEERFVEESGVYPLHKELIVSYLKTGICKRNEEALESEIKYEIYEVKNSIKNIFAYMSTKRKYLVVLNKLHLAEYSTIHLLSEILDDSRLKKNIKIVATYNEVYSIPLTVQDIWKKFIGKVHDMDILYDWGRHDSQKTTDIQNVFIPEVEKIDEYLVLINNMVLLFAQNEANYYLEILYQYIEREKFPVSNKKKRKIMVLSILNSIYSNEPNKALLMCDNYYLLIEEDDELFMKYVYYYLYSMAQTSLLFIDAAVNSAKLCEKYARLLENETYIFKAQVLCYIARYAGWKSIFITDYTYKVDDEFINKLIENGYDNILAYVYAYSFENDRECLDKIVSGEYFPEYFNESLDIGWRLGNKNFLLSAYMKNIILFSNAGYHDYVNALYKKRLEIIKSQSDSIRESHTYIGLGFNSIVSEKYVQANEYFNGALSILVKSRLPEQISECLYNMSLNCICAFDYESAKNYLETTLKILNNLKLHRIKICNTSKLYCMLALCHYYLDENYKCYLYLNKAQRILNHLLEPSDNPDYDKWHEDICLFYFVNGLLKKRENQLVLSKELFDKAYFHCISDEGSMFFTYTMLLVEKIDLCSKLGENEEKERLLDEGIEYCNKKGYTYKVKLLLEILAGEKDTRKKISPPLFNFNLSDIVEISRQVGVVYDLKDRQKDIGFLASWQDILNRDDNINESLINNAMVALSNTFNLDQIVVLSRDKRVIKTLYDNGETPITEQQQKTVFDFFSQYETAVIVSRTDENFLLFKKILDIFNVNSVVTLIGIPVFEGDRLKSVLIAIEKMHFNFTLHYKLLNKNNLQIIKLAFVQLQAALGRAKYSDEIRLMNKKLEKTVITDNLTGLFNRQGLADKIERDQEKYCNNTNSVMYIDLDNFKYYNDTFGHNVGDEVLKEFAMIFKKVVKNNGFAVRYGGDEFVLVLYGKKSDYACGVAREIYKYITDDMHIAHDEGRVVPEDKTISCSIGITEFSGCTSEIVYNALTKADKILYEVKRNSKGTYNVYK